MEISTPSEVSFSCPQTKIFFFKEKNAIGLRVTVKQTFIIL